MAPQNLLSIENPMHWKDTPLISGGRTIVRIFFIDATLKIDIWISGDRAGWTGDESRAVASSA
jgi:hypothetical protein